jgi:enolase-phosphatase E1
MTAVQRRLYVLDVEGTVAPISLVTEELFPYARLHLPQFLNETVGDPEVEADLALLREENRAETDALVPLLPALSSTPEGTAPAAGDNFRGADRAFRRAALAYLVWLMDRDRKSTALKSLQGKIWKKGFLSGELKGRLFADVPVALFRWSARAQVAIYSSGSVAAQQLLFRHSNYGDLASRITGYFDTRTGPKRASTSYAAIARSMGVEPKEGIFFSDVVEELDAAREAGLDTRLVVREGNAPVSDDHEHIRIDRIDQTS